MMKRADSWSHIELMTFALTNYNNLLLLKVWKNPEDRNKENKFLAFVTETKKELSELKKEK